MAGLKDIAARTGLSMNTVSRALRQSGYVSEATARKVRLAAEELHYHPNRAARELRNNCSHAIAVVAESGDFLHIQKIAAIQETAAANGYTTNNFLVANEFAHGRLPAITEVLLSDRPAGVILIGMDRESIDAARNLRTHFPVALVPYTAIPDLDCVYIDRRQGVYEAIRHLYRQGCRRIAYLGSDTMGNKLKGYRDALTEFGLPEIWIPADDVGEGRTARENTRRLARAIAAMPERPDGIQCADYYAASLAAELPALGIKVPEDIALVGFDNRDFVEVIQPALSTVAQPSRQVGAAVARLLLDRIRAKNEGPTRQLKIPMSLVIRDSSAFGGKKIDAIENKE